MGPRFLGRGNGMTGLSGRAHGIASMGPRFLGRGNPGFQDAYHLGPPASMGPRFLGRGNLPILITPVRLD